MGFSEQEGLCRSAPQGQRIRSRPRPRCVGAVVLGILDLTKCNASFFFKEMNEQSLAVLQDWRRKEIRCCQTESLDDSRNSQGVRVRSEVYLQATQADDFVQISVYASLCCFSLHKQHPSTKVSRHVCLPKAK